MSIYSKIAKIQDKVQNIVKDGRNPHFSNTYATYEQVMKVLHPLLREQGLMVCHSFAPPVDNESLIGVTTRIVETEVKDSEVATTLYLPMTKNDPQMAGSAVTYSKRYSVLAMFGLGTEDDDGNKATPAPKPATAPQAPTKPQPATEQATEGPMAGNVVPCKQCGGATTFREGVNANTGKWQGYFCSDNRHKPFFIEQPK